MKQKINLKTGFTIVELLIVIIVIGILATIVVMGYNGAQVRVKNAKTASAVADWANAFRLYQTKEDYLPAGSSCLGNSDTYPSSECEPGLGVDSSVASKLTPYLGNGDVPEPDTTKITNPSDSGDYRIGISYYSPDGISGNIWYVQADTDQCPKIGALNNNSVNLSWDGGIECVGSLPNSP